jgi:hypothetical protein
MHMQHHETSAFLPCSAERAFSQLDDHRRLSSHMSKPSWKMGGGRMQIEFDAAQGKSVGSRIRLAERVFGVDICVDEVVVEHRPPVRKVWETVGSPRLLVIGHYRMGFELTPQATGSVLRVFIDYSLPETMPGRWLGRLLGLQYAKWCTQQMVDDAVKHFAKPA